MATITTVPLEILCNIVSHLSVEDVFHLSQTCKCLVFILDNESLCKSIVQTSIPHAKEAQDAKAVDAIGGYALALRSYAKRQLATRTANPFSAAIVGICDAFIYCKGILCYTLEDKLRLLDLHKSSQSEIVVSIPDLLRQALPRIKDHAKGLFKVLYCANYIVSCLYTSSGDNSASWLVSFHARYNRLLFVKDLVSTENLFVRHNEDYIYYGTHSEISAQQHRKWVVYGFDIRAKYSCTPKHLPDLVGSDIGSTVCFEINDGYFYALSNHTSFEMEEIDFSSFYFCERFPLDCESDDLNGMDQPINERIASAEPCIRRVRSSQTIWRRQHDEGPLDDRWTALSLVASQETNELSIVESRREWQPGASRSQRTSYTTYLSFDNEAELVMAEDDVGMAVFTPNISSIGSAHSSPGSLSPHGTSTSTLGTASHRPPQRDISLLPETPLKQLLQECDNPLYSKPIPRLPENIHPTGSTVRPFTSMKSKVRSYCSSSNSFMDLVDDPVANDALGRQRLQLRIESRRLAPPPRYENNILLSQEEISSLDLDIALKNMFVNETVKLWPDNGDSKYSTEELSSITDLLNPPTHLGNVEGFADEFGLVYATGMGKGPQALIWIGFDPRVKLQGLTHLRKRGSREAEVPAYVVKDEIESDIENSGESQLYKKKKWAWREPAMYRHICRGFYFGL